MAQEKEIKIVLKIPLNTFIKRIKATGYELVHILSQEDKYYDTQDWFLYENLAALRLRKVNKKVDSFSFKKIFYMPNKKNKYFIEEIELNSPFRDLNKFRRIFSRLQIPYDQEKLKNDEDLTEFLKRHDYHDDQILFKKRNVYSHGDNEIIIDEIDKVGTIIELECKKDDPLVLVQDYLDDAEWERSIEGTSYLWLRKVKGLTSHNKNIKKFRSIPDWNVWENEQKMYEKLNQELI